VRQPANAGQSTFRILHLTVSSHFREMMNYSFWTEREKLFGVLQLLAVIAKYDFIESEYEIIKYELHYSDYEKGRWADGNTPQK
jgi:hypothetical protein